MNANDMEMMIKMMSKFTDLTIYGKNIEPKQKEKKKFELIPVSFDDEYAKKWNIRAEDNYCHLYKDGKKVRNTLYRLGGMDKIRDNDYFILLKYDEAYYSDKITKDLKKKRHLASQFCILDKDGNEKFCSSGGTDYPYLIGGCLYNYKDEIYNIETGYCYGKGRNYIKSENFIFLTSESDWKIHEKIVTKINKHTGEFEEIK
jgi:hypothetical protein